MTTRVGDREYRPGLRDFWHDMNRHNTAEYWTVAGYDYVIEAQHGFLKVWRAVSDDPHNEENYYEWEKVGERRYADQHGAKSSGAGLGRSVKNVRRFVEENPH